MDSSYMQSSSDLSIIQMINSLLFIILVVVIVMAITMIIRFSRQKPGVKPSLRKEKFINLEKEFKWRRLKVVYLVVSVLIIFFVIGISYGEGERAPLQAYQDYQVEREADRTATTVSAIAVSLLLWSGYFLALPFVYSLMGGAKKYLSDTGDSTD